MRIRHPLYAVWCGMRSRCNNPNDPAYANYGGRGIAVDPRWNNFSDFAKDMGLRPVNYTLERKDNDKGYSPDNCVWASRKTQARNTRRTVFVGDACLKDAAIAAGIDPSTARVRLKSRGTLTPTTGKIEKRVAWGGETKSVRAWAKDPRCVVTLGALVGRLKRGWDFERAITQPARVQIKFGAVEGETVNQWAKKLGIAPANVYARLHKHGSVRGKQKGVP